MLPVFSMELVEFDVPLSGLQTHKAIRTFKIMRSCGLPANTAIYNVMIECCKLLPCFKSASTLLSLMLRDGCCPTVVTYTSLLKVRLDNCRPVITHYATYCLFLCFS
jgi:pentatricopeptide repeat protein